MRLKSLLLTFAIVLTIACSKSKNSVDTRPLKAVPNYKMVSDRVIKLDAYQSEGPVTKWKWARIDTGTIAHPFYFITSEYEIQTQVEIYNPYMYVYRLTVYDKDSNSNSQVITINVIQ